MEGGRETREGMGKGGGGGNEGADRQGSLL